MARLTTSLVCLWAIQAMFLMENAVADPEIDINPIVIRLGISSTLDINCTISLKNYPDMAALVSLNLLRANASGQDFQELALITEFSPESVNLVTQEKVAATGVLNETGESFLQITWDFPTVIQGGVYQCTAHGVDMLGHCVELTNTSVVTANESNVSDIFEKLKKMESHEQLMENKISSMENHIQTLEDTVCHLISFTITNELELIGTYQDKSYYVSIENYQDINKSSTVCKLCGGTLIEIDDEDEYNAVVGFFQNIKSDSPRAIIGGTDEQSEGNWVLPSTNKPLPYTAWYTNEPGVTRSYNCLGMYKNYSWKMYDEQCDYGSPYAHHFFTCEIPFVGHAGQQK